MAAAGPLADVPDRHTHPDHPGSHGLTAGVVLAWIARGAAAYHRDGLGVPDAVLAATNAYAADQDSVGAFVTEACMKASAGRVKVADLRAAYEKFCRDSGDVPVSAKRFGEQLRDSHGIQLGRDKASRYYEGVMLYADDAADGQGLDIGSWHDR